ncbi:MAG: bifunctional enzyme CysN/CysC [Bradymonadia bacterium]|jgi:bifunctional enzyme CysN/CysC
MITADTLDTDIITFLKRHENKELLRFVTVGSVDDGKSTLIGRLLYDTGGVYEDQLADARSGPNGELDLARITDGLAAEREQGITIDVAYRYFTTKKRKFIIADTPGHVQYTRNMATGASTADVAIILIDARLGVLQQSRRHAYIASLLGIPHLLVAVNKMDLRDWSSDVYEQIRDDFTAFASDLSFKKITFVPVSALIGDNVVAKSEAMPWYTGPTILEFLETVEVGADRNFDDFRMPVQYVIRPNLDYRGFAGQISSGIIEKGDFVKVLPSGKTSRVAAIDTYDGELERAFTPQSVTIRLEDEIDCSRGDTLVKVGNEPTTARTFDAMVVWMHESGIDPQKTYLIKHTTRYVRAEVTSVNWRADLETLERLDADALELNDIGHITLTAHRAITYDPYPQNRSTGAFIMIDSLTNATVAAGMIVARDGGSGEAGLLDVSGQPQSGVSPRERSVRLGQRGGTVWFTGRPGSGKSTLAYALERRLFDLGYLPTVLDPEEMGDENRFEHERALDVRQIADTARRFSAAGLVTIATFATPTESERAGARDAAGDSHFFEVFVDTPTSICRDRDARNFYAKLDAGQLEVPLPDFEVPTSPDATVNLETSAVDDVVDGLIDAMREKGLLLGT